MTFAPGWSQSYSKGFQLTFKIARGFPSGPGCQFNDIVLLEIENPQIELCRSPRESLMINHAVSAIRDPRTGVSLRNSSGQAGKRRYSDRDTATPCRREFFD